MSCKIAKIFCSLCLSMLLGYAGVAWAFEGCSSEAHDSGDESYGIVSLLADARSVEGHHELIHCSTNYHNFDVVAATGLPGSLRQSKDYQRSPSLSPGIAGRGIASGFTRDSPPGWVDRSPSSFRLRHSYLAFSVLLL